MSYLRSRSSFNRGLFGRFASWIAHKSGQPLTFAIAFIIIIGWAISGPLFHFSNTWQLVINTGTTIITFLMVFLIQNTQNRDSEAMHIKLDELIRSHREAKNELIDLEELTEKDLDKLRNEYIRLAQEAKRASNSKTPPIHE